MLRAVLAGGHNGWTVNEVICRSIGEAADALRAAAARRQRVFIAGGSTKFTPPTNGGPAVLLRTTGLSRLLELSPGDLTCTVEAGMTLAALDAALAPHRVRLPLDPPEYGGRATVGGVLAANDSGPLRLAHGTARDQVIGMSMVLADGAHIKAGGRVVKNVAGFDLHRLFVGSAGSLGMIATVSLKLKPRAPVLRLVLIPACTGADAERRTAALLCGETRPALLDWVVPSTALCADEWPIPSGARMVVAVGYEDTAEAASAQVSAALAAHAGAIALDDSAAARVYQALRERVGISAAAVRLHGCVPAGLLAQVVGAASAGEALATDSGGGHVFHSHAGSGVVHFGTHVAPAADALAAVMVAAGGWASVRRSAATFTVHRRVSDVVDSLERGLRRQLDPAGLFPDPPFLADERGTVVGGG